MVGSAVPRAQKPPDLVSGARRPLTASSSPTSKGDRDTQQAKKKVRAMDLNQSAGLGDVEIEDVSHEETTQEESKQDSPMKETYTQPNAWTERVNSLFEEYRGHDEWYVADSDSEDVAEAMREEDDMVDDEEDDPLCPQICFTAAEKASFRRPWRSALVVKGLGRNVPYLPLARRLNFLWAKHGNIQISDLKNGCYLVRFRCHEDYEGAEAGARGKYARVCVEVDLSKRLLPKYKVEGATYLVVYEGFHKICTNCGMYGAPSHLCQCCKPKVVDLMIPEQVEPQQNRDSSNGKVFGEWMMPKRKAWRRTNSAISSTIHSSPVANRGNRFEALNTKENDTFMKSTPNPETTDSYEENNQRTSIAAQGIHTRDKHGDAILSDISQVRHDLVEGVQSTQERDIEAEKQTDKTKEQPLNSIAAKGRVTKINDARVSAVRHNAKGGERAKVHGNHQISNATTKGAGNLSPPEIR
ncbi:hypothetical protein LINGRAHAP2_LOCUS1567 [Linum grandiflorum]